MLKYYNLANVFVCPSIHEKNWKEQFGMVFVESMAFSTVPIGSSLGVIPEVIDSSGLLSIPGDYQDLATNWTFKSKESTFQY